MRHWRVLTGRPCRFCNAPAYLVDLEGPVHPCCELWIGERGAKSCPACAGFNARGTENGTRRRSARGDVPKPLLAEQRADTKETIYAVLRDHQVDNTVLVRMFGPDAPLLTAELVEDGLVEQDGDIYRLRGRAA